MRKMIQALPLVASIIALLSMTSVNAASNGLGISPRKDYTVQAGKSISDTVYLSNLSVNQDLQVDLKVLDFGAQNESGAPALQLDESVPPTPWSLKPFIKLPASIQVAAGKSTYIPIKVTIPSTQGAGSYYSAIEYNAVNPLTKQKVNIAASTATLVFVTVPGQTTEQLIVKQFGAWKSNAAQTDGQFQNWFVLDSPAEFAYRLQNQGNIAEQPSGSMLIKNIFGHTVKEVDDANPKKQLVLIGQTRRVQFCVNPSVLTSKAPNQSQSSTTVCDDPGLLPGRYTAMIALYYGLNGNNTQEIRVNTVFWYFPVWFLISLAVAIIIVIGLIWLIRRAFSGGSRRRYRR